MAALPPSALTGPTPDRRRRPERTLLYRTVQSHLETWLALRGRAYDDADAVPGYVEHEFCRYLECGILAHGFARARCAQCGHDFLIAFSCKGRGVCSSCNTRRMAETAAHLVEHVIPRVPVRQRMLSLPNACATSCSTIRRLQPWRCTSSYSAVEQPLRRCSPGASPHAGIGAVAFIQRFGALLNAHVHFHCIVLDGVFEADGEGGARFPEAMGVGAEAVAEAQTKVRRPLLRALAQRGLLEPEDAEAMSASAHAGGFSVDASVRIEAHDRAGLERLLRCCARPAFALERLHEIDAEHLVYDSAKPGPGGSVTLMLTLVELLDRLAALIPPPRRHRHRYFGVRAPNAPLRPTVTALVTAGAETPIAETPAAPTAAPAPGSRRAHPPSAQ